ncbi:hypothetical protein M0802_016813 [Mischocyttarus mexicanus]|nr:hypothetical protein M0802_016813 [Mischocyttarus mexicanus]
MDSLMGEFYEFMLRDELKSYVVFESNLISLQYQIETEQYQIKTVHHLLRLAPYSLMFNAIEHVWSSLKADTRLG